MSLTLGARPARPGIRLFAVGRDIVGWLGARLMPSTDRHRLLELDDRMLSDLGISRAQAEFEARRWR